MDEVGVHDRWLRRRPAFRAVVDRWPERAMLACSGGLDSSALVLLAGCARREGRIGPFVVVHVDHRTRPGSAAEAERVADLARAQNAPFMRVAIAVDAHADPGSSPEERLRTARYDALARSAARIGVSSAVTAHTRDDQVETILLRLLSGAGGVGAAGMTARATLDTSVSQLEIVRPMLDTPRSELAEIVDRLGVAPVTDPTNDDPRFRRNALRRDIIPLLREHFAGFESALTRSVAIAARDAAAIDLLARREFDLIASTSDIATRVDRRRLRELPEAISTRVIRLAAARLMPDNRRELTFERVERVRDSVDGRSGARIELPYGVVVTVEREHLAFERRDPAGG